MEIPIDLETGEILPVVEMVTIDKLPAIIIDLADVALFYSDPQQLVDKINIQAGNPIFDMTTKKGRDECKSDAAKIIRCISPAEKESKRLDADYAKKIKQGLNFRKDFESGVRKIAALHRKPLTDWETEQDELKQELIRRENRRLEAEKLLQDHQDAIDLDELYTHRKARELAEQIAEAERKAIEDKRLFDEAVIEQTETMRLQIEADALRKAEAERAEKLEAERKKVRDEEQARINEERRLERIEFDKIQGSERLSKQELQRQKVRDITAENEDFIRNENKRFREDERKADEFFTDAEFNGMEERKENYEAFVEEMLAESKKEDHEAFYDNVIDCEPTVFKDGLETITILKSEYDELISRSERLFELETEFS
jgi:hypothetical protein